MSTPVKKLYRSRNDKMLGGVCAGLAKHFNIDPTIVRLVYVMFTMLSVGFGVFVYLLFWVITPEAPENAKTKGHVYEHED